MVVTGVIISSCHSDGKNRIGRFGNFGVWCAWSMAYCHNHPGMYHPCPLGCTSAAWAWLASSLALCSSLDVTNRTNLLPEFTAVVGTTIYLPFVLHLGKQSFTSRQRTVRTTVGCKEGNSASAVCKQGRPEGKPSYGE